MKLYSQRDPAYNGVLLPKSKLSVRSYGCYVFCTGTLGQVDPLSLLRDELFVQGGLVLPAAMAEAAGMTYVGPSTTAPQGWCVGRTAYYANIGFPTHFLLVNVDTQQMVDPLKYPAKVQPLTYEINQYRVYSGIRFDPTPPPPVYVAPKVPEIPSWAREAVKKAKKAGIETPLTDTIGSMPLYQFLTLIDKYNRV